MRNGKGGRDKRKIMHSKPVLVILGVVILLFAWNVAGFVGKLKETAKNKNIAEGNMRELSEAKVKLSEDIARLETEVGIEENIREKFGLAKEGEGMVVIVEEKNKVEPDKEKEKKGIFNFLKNLFK